MKYQTTHTLYQQICVLLVVQQHLPYIPNTWKSKTHFLPVTNIICNMLMLFILLAPLTSFTSTDLFRHRYFTICICLQKSYRQEHWSSSAIIIKILSLDTELLIFLSPRSHGMMQKLCSENKRLENVMTPVIYTSIHMSFDYKISSI